MSAARIDMLVIAGGVLLWAAIFLASAQGRLGVSGLVSDGLLAGLALLIGWGLWRLYRRGRGKGA